MKECVYIYTRNHQSIYSIQDHIEQVKLILNRYNLKLIVSEKLHKNATNIIIEEFTNPKEINLLKKLKSQYPKTKLICFLTELPTRHFLRKSFNEKKFKLTFFLLEIFLKTLKITEFFKIFGILLRKFSIFIPLHKYSVLASFYIYYCSIYNPFFLKSKIINFIRFFRLKEDIYYNLNNEKEKFFFNVNIDEEYNFNIFGFDINLSSILRFLLFNQNKLIQEYSYNLYMKKRFESLNKSLFLFDYFFTFHEKITINFKTITKIIPKTLYPEIKKNIKIKDYNKNIVITGSKTPYRKKIIEKFSFYLTDGAKLYIKDFINSSQHSKYSLNLNIPQEKDWAYSSPIRYVRALNLGQIPIVFKKYDDHPVEKLGFLLKFKTKLLDEMKYFRGQLHTKLKEYKKLSQMKNYFLIKAIKKDIHLKAELKKNNFIINDDIKFVDKTKYFNIYVRNNIFYALKKNFKLKDLNNYSFKQNSLETLKKIITQYVINKENIRNGLVLFTQNFLIIKKEDEFHIHKKSFFLFNKELNLNYKYNDFFESFNKIKDLEKNILLNKNKILKKYKKKINIFFYINFNLIQ